MNIIDSDMEKNLPTFNVGNFDGDELFSIVIPTWNNLDFLKLCVKSIVKNSTYKHQIVLHVNDGSDGTLEWAKEQGFSFTHTNENCGICFAVNAARALVKTEYILYLNDDMYVCPGWDKALKEEIDSANTKYFFFSATLIEPYQNGDSSIISGKNFGTTIQNFEEERLLKEFDKIQKDDWSGATWPPNIVHRDVWDLVGGYSVELSPGMYSDPDFSAKLWKVGVRLFKGISQSRAYHFVSKSVGRIKKNNGRKQFLVKWKIASSTFGKFYLKRGQRFEGKQVEPVKTFKYKVKKLRDFISSKF